MRQLNFRYVSAVLALCAGIASGVLVAVSPVCAASIEVEGAQSWQAQIDEQQRHATIIETIGPGPGPVLKKFLNVNAAGVWSTTVIATNRRSWDSCQVRRRRNQSASQPATLAESRRRESKSW